jgi:hypothetical protein
VAIASTSVPAPVASDEIVAQSVASTIIDHQFATVARSGRLPDGANDETGARTAPVQCLGRCLETLRSGRPLKRSV